MTKVADLIERLKDDSSDLVYHERHEAAAELLRLSSECEALREALEWYGEQARLARLIHSEGDAGRHALSEDGGKRASTALQETNGGGNADVRNS